VLWDDALPGFGLRITERGSKSFVLSYRAGGRKRFLTLGLYGVLTLDQARNKALKELASVLEGADPVEQRREERRRAETYVHGAGHGPRAALDELGEKILGAAKKS